jgi:hypothetical protein
MELVMSVFEDRERALTRWSEPRNLLDNVVDHSVIVLVVVVGGGVADTEH